MKLNLYLEFLVFICLVLVFAAAARQRNVVWENRISLWSDVVNKSPNKHRPHHNLGRAYSRTEHYDLALKEYEQALRVKPFSPKTHVNIGLVYEKMGQDMLAISMLKKALEMDPNDYKAYAGLGAIYRRGSSI